MNVSDTPVSLGYGAQLVQNLGPDELYLGESDVDSSTGVLLNANESTVVATRTHDLYVVSAGSSDVRTLSRGQGIFPAFVIAP